MNYFKGKNGVYIIAEVGGNHEGDYQYAVRLLKLAAESGVDAVKFQIYTGDSLVNPLQDPDRNQYFKRFQLNTKQYIALAEMCSELGVFFMASVWDPEALDYIDSYIPIYKIGSGDLTAYSIIRKIIEKKKPIILSTGLATLDEVLQTIRYIESIDCSYIHKKKIALMQCTTMYPSSNEDANLNIIKTLRETTGLPVGFSDHTLGTFAIEIAVAMGAEIIEKHFTDSREGKTFRDHFVSATKEEMISFIEKVKRIKVLKGNTEKKPVASEIDAGHLKVFRRALYPARDLKAGEILCGEDLLALRPCIGIGAEKLDRIVGRRLAKDVAKYEALYEHFFIQVRETYR